MIDWEAAEPYLRRHRGTIVVVKVGGACLEGAPARQVIAAELSLIESLGVQLVIVHGAGPQTDALLRAEGEEPRKVGGRRVTTPRALAALERASAALNADLVRRLQARGCTAAGWAGGRGALLQARRRPEVSTAEGPVDFGLVGDLQRVDVEPVLASLRRGTTPVLAPLAVDAEGQLLNVNADLAAAYLAAALPAAKLVFLTAAPGLLEDAQRPDTLLSSLSHEDLVARLSAGTLQGGMQVKAVAAVHALDHAVPDVHIVAGGCRGALFGELYTTQGTGTWIHASERCVPAHEPPGRTQEVVR